MLFSCYLETNSEAPRAPLRTFLAMKRAILKVNISSAENILLKMNNQDSMRQSCSPWVEQESHSYGATFYLTNNSLATPYRTMPVRQKNNKMASTSVTPTPQAVLKSYVTSPYRRINRVNKMIMNNRQEVQSSNDSEEWSKRVNLFRTQFKIKSLRNTLKQQEVHRQNSQKLKVHVRNFTLDNFSLRRPEQLSQDKHQTNTFQENFKKRCRLQKKPIKSAAKDASLLDRLNKITERAPLNRYKSRAFGVSTRVTPFTGNI